MEFASGKFKHRLCGVNRVVFVDRLRDAVVLGIGHAR